MCTQAEHYLAGHISSDNWPLTFGIDHPHPGDIGYMAGSGEPWPYGDSQALILPYEPRKESHRSLVERAMACAAKMGDFVRKCGLPQEGPLTAAELAGVALWSRSFRETDSVLPASAKGVDAPGLR